MKTRLEVLIGWVLIALGLSLAWPPGRQAYELLAHWGGFNFDWWQWPTFCITAGLMALNLKSPQARRFNLWVSAVLFTTVSASVYLSVGPNSLTAVLLIMALGSVRAMTDLKGLIQQHNARPPLLN